MKTSMNQRYQGNVEESELLTFQNNEGKKARRHRHFEYGRKGNHIRQEGQH